jgi:hypothetical protein
MATHGTLQPSHNNRLTSHPSLLPRTRAYKCDIDLIATVTVLHLPSCDLLICLCCRVLSMHLHIQCISTLVYLLFCVSASIMPRCAYAYADECDGDHKNTVEEASHEYNRWFTDHNTRDIWNMSRFVSSSHMNKRMVYNTYGQFVRLISSWISIRQSPRQFN